MWEVQIVYISIGIDARTMWGTYISARRGGGNWLCCSSTNTFAIFAISAIPGVLDGLRIKRTQLFVKFVGPSGAKRARARNRERTHVHRALASECGGKDGGDTTRAETLAGMAMKEGAYIRGRRSQRRPGITSHCSLTS